MGGVLRRTGEQVVNTERFIMLIILYRFIDEQCQRNDYACHSAKIFLSILCICRVTTI